MPTYKYRTTTGINTTTDVKECLNPWKNDTYIPDASYVDLCDAIDLLMEAANGAELISKLVEAVPFSTAPWRALVARLYEQKPDLVRRWMWILFPCARSERDWYTVYPRLERSDLSVDYFFEDGDSRTRTVAEELAQFEEAVNKWSGHAQRRLDSVRFGPYKDICHFLRRFLMDTDSYLILQSQYVSPRQARIAVPASDIQSVSFSFSTVSAAAYVSLQRNRAALYRTLAHSYDVTQALGKGTPSQRTRKIGDKAVTVAREAQPVLYGVELEISTDETTQKLIDAQKDLFLVCKSDGSITGSKGNLVEMVTLPQDLRSHRQTWGKLLGGFFCDKAESYPTFDVTNRTSNGMHIHIARTAFVDEEHQKRFTFFFVDPLNQDFHVAIAERPLSQISQWAAFPSYGLGQSRKDIYNNCQSVCRGLGKYCVLNYSKTETLEARMFKGLFSFATIMKNLEFVDAVLHYTLDTLSWVQLSLNGFVKWLKSRAKNKYKALRRFLAKIELADMLEENKIRLVVARVKEPADALRILEKNGVPPSRSLVGILNNHFGGKKYFHWVAKESKIVLTNKDKAILFGVEAEFLKPYTRNKSAA